MSRNITDQVSRNNRDIKIIERRTPDKALSLGNTSFKIINPRTNFENSYYITHLKKKEENYLTVFYTYNKFETNNKKRSKKKLKLHII